MSHEEPNTLIKELVEGNEPVYEPFFVRKELSCYEDDPLVHLIKILDSRDESELFHDERSRYSEQYYFYYLSLKRYFEDMYYSIKWDKDLKWAKQSGEKYTDYQKKIAKKYHERRPFLEYDFVNCLLHARILCDRSIALSRYFLRGEKLPSFMSCVICRITVGVL